MPAVERLGVRLECSVFAPMDISQPLPIPGLTAVDGMSLDKEMQELTAQAKEVRRVYEARRESRYLYLTWDLFAFDFWKDLSDNYHLVQRTMLALWTAWPKYSAWAPQSPKGFSSPSFSLKEATHLLTDLLPALRRYFFALKEAHHLRSPELTFSSRTLYPPTFYFADPTIPLPTADKYTENQDVRYLISNCTGYDDPYAETLSWSTLEGSIATIRGETTQERHQKAYYLLLPIAARPDQEEIGSDLDQIVDFLTYQEYTVGLEAEDIFKRVKDIESKRAVDSETIDTVDSFTRKLARLVSTLPREALKSGTEEFAELQLLLGRVQYALEKMRSEADEIEHFYKHLVKIQMEYLRQNMIMAPVSKLLCLSAALKDNYPYRSLQSRMNRLSAYTAQLANISKRLGTLLALLSTAISNDALKERERQDRQIQIFVAMITAFTLLVTLSTLFPDVDALSILKLFKWETIYNANNGKILLVSLLALAFLLFLLWLRNQIWRRMTAYSKHRQEDIRFSEHVRQFWDRAEYTSYMNEEKKRRKEGKLALMPFLLELCARSWQHLRVREPEQEDIRFSEHVRQFWDLAEFTAYLNEAKKRGEKDCLLPLSPALNPPPPNWFKKYWNDGMGVESIDSRATWILEGLWHYLDNPSRESSTNKQPPWIDNKQHASEDMLAQVRVLRRLIHVFVLRPDLIPLPRALCILRYKSLQFLDKSTIADNEFLESLTCAGFTPNQVKHLQDWLNKEENKCWIRDKSVDKVAEALRKAGITVNLSEDAVNNWQDDLARYSSD